MRRFVMFGFVVALSAVMSFLPQVAETAVVTNLLSDPGFEEYLNSPSPWTYGGNANWSCDISHTGAMSGDIGGWRGTGTSGWIFQSFALPADVDTLEFGAYFYLITNGTAGNWDQSQINLQISASNTTIGGSISNFPISWTDFGTGRYESGWFLVSGIVDTSNIGYVPGSSINISLQDYSGAETRLFVDDVYVGQLAAVPEPGTIILLGSGVLGLAGWGRKRLRR